MAQQLRTFVALEEDPGFGSQLPQGGSKLSVTGVSKELMPSLASKGARHRCGTHTYPQAKHSNT